MRRIPALATLALVSASSLAMPGAGAQDVRILPRSDTWRVMAVADDRPMIGVTTAAGSERGDTLGLRIEQVTKDSPADKAGLKAGDRLQAVNGVSLRADRADAGEDDYAGVLTRRLQREVQKTDAGDAVELRVLSAGQSRTVRVTPGKASEVMRMPEMSRREWGGAAADRAVIGLNVSSTGSVRDTIGVFVMSVVAGGPAEKAGIIEGDRIAAINGVSLKVAREDAEDRSVGASRMDRLSREVAKLESGQQAELTVVTAGRSRTVRVTAVKASELPGGEGSFSLFAVPQDGFRVRPDLPQLREFAPRMEELRRRLETERTLSPSRTSRRVII